jgi:ketosteroid isomerase-like protein
MASYNDALNGGKTAGVMPLYADDGVFMPPYSQSAVGKAAVGKPTTPCSTNSSSTSSSRSRNSS